MSLDSPASCVEELASINHEIAEWGYQWAQKAGDLKAKLKYRERLRQAAMRGMEFEKGITAAEKTGIADVAVEKTEPEIHSQIEALEGEVERFATQFETLKRRSSNAQSILSALKDERYMSAHVADPQWTPGAGFRD